MTSHADLPHGSSSATRVRVRWDNIMIVLIGVTAAAFAVVAILMGGDSTEQPPASTGPAVETEAAAPALETAEPGSLTLDDAVSLVEEVRALMAEGRWDEATDRLELVPDDLRDASGATTALADLEAARTEHEQLRAQLQAAVEARNFTTARALVTKLSALAPLDAELTATKELIDKALTPAAGGETGGGASDSATPTATKATTGGGASTAGTSTGGGAGSSTSTTGSGAAPAATTPTTSKPKPATTKPSTTKPATGGARPTTGGGSTGSSNSTGGSPSTGTPGAGSAGAGATSPLDQLGDLGINLSPQEQADLAAALEQAMAQL